MFGAASRDVESLKKPSRNDTDVKRILRGAQRKRRNTSYKRQPVIENKYAPSMLFRTPRSEYGSSHTCFERCFPATWVDTDVIIIDRGKGLARLGCFRKRVQTLESRASMSERNVYLATLPLYDCQLRSTWMSTWFISSTRHGVEGQLFAKKGQVVA